VTNNQGCKWDVWSRDRESWEGDETETSEWQDRDDTDRDVRVPVSRRVRAVDATSPRWYSDETFGRDIWAV